MPTNEIIRDTSGNTVTIDRTAGGRYSVLGPAEDGQYKVRDHEDDQLLASVTDREIGITRIEELPDDRLSGR